MNEFSHEVKLISQEFIDEAKRSPKLLSDMAKMEYYMAESYNGRVFIELLQNADDAQSTKVLLCIKGDDIYFANNGRPFSKSDILAISRSGNSTKTFNQKIGYRGIGFKSVVSISNEVIIHSNSTYFTFSKDVCAAALSLPEDQIPTIRVPFLLEKVQNDVSSEIEKIKRNGYSTIFVFRRAAIDIFLDEIQSIHTAHFLFLNNINDCFIFTNEQIKKHYVFHKVQTAEGIQIVGDDSIQKKEWLLIQRNGISIAFQVDNGVIVPCDLSDSVYHCYLPTQDKSMIHCKINANFPTDPSRKHLVFNESTKSILNSVANLLFDFIKYAFQHAMTGKYQHVLSMILDCSIISKSNAFLYESLNSLIAKREWLLLNNGKYISPSNYKLLPNDLMGSILGSSRCLSVEISNESLPSYVYTYIDNVDKYLSQFSINELSVDLFVKTLSSKNNVSQMDRKCYLELLVYIIRELRIQSRIYNKPVLPYKSIFIKTQADGFATIDEIQSNNLEIDTKLKSHIYEMLTSADISWFETNIKSNHTATTELAKQGVNNDSNNTCKTENKVMQQIHSIDANRIVLPKWRNAEYQCLILEKSNGNHVTDISLKNLGYDILSITPNGETKYIEVKSVNSDYMFSLTNNEYATAHEYKEKYYIYLFFQREDDIEVKCIRNPIKYAKFEKRIRQWEWICIDFVSDSKHFKLS